MERFSNPTHGTSAYAHKTCRETLKLRIHVCTYVLMSVVLDTKEAIETDFGTVDSSDSALLVKKTMILW